MQSSTKHVATMVASFALILVAILSFYYIELPARTAVGEVQSSSCGAMVSRVVPIGHQQSTLVVATTSNRASLHIQQPVNATNTVHFNFSYASATLATATWVLEHVSASGTIRDMYIGKNTNFPYSGPITALSSSGSTTLLVTECLY